MRNWILMLGAAGAVACGGGKDSGGCDDGSLVRVTLSDSANNNNPILGSIEWVDADGEPGAMDCPGACEFAPAVGTVSVTAMPADVSVGDAQTDTANFQRSDDCSAAVFTGMDFVW